MSLLVVGSIAYDSVKTPFGKKDEVLGGSALYCGLAASFFVPVNLVAVVGSDFSKRHLKFLRERGIDTKGLQIKKGKTFRWKAEYSYDLNMRKTLATHLNVLRNFKPKLPESYKDSKYIFLANLDPDLQHMVLDELNYPKLVACDTMNLWIERKRDSLMKLLKRVEIFIINESEARELTAEPNLIKAGRKICNLGPKMVILKKGEDGALFFGKHFKFLSVAYPLESVYDPTGSGDVFAGGFMGYLTKQNKLTKSSFKKALIYGTILASFNVESFSIERLKKLRREDIDKRYKELKRLTHF